MGQGATTLIVEPTGAAGAAEIARRTWDRLAPLALDIERTITGLIAGGAVPATAAELRADVELLAKAGDALRKRLTFTVELMSSADLDEGHLGRLRHDLRTPLNSLKGYCELLLDEAGAWPGIERDLTDIHNLIDLFRVGIDEQIKVPGPEDALRGEIDPPVQDEEPGAAPMISGRILLVEDHDASRAVVSRFLAKDGHVVVEAADGTSALRLLAAEPIDVVLLDHHLPDLEGNEILRRMKADPRWASIPIIMISAGDEALQIGTSLKLGADDYVAKPIDRVLLRARLAACLDRKHLRDRDNAFWFNSLRTVMDLAVDGIVILTAGGEVEAANPIACGIFATTAETFLGMAFGPLIGQDGDWTPRSDVDPRRGDTPVLREVSGYRVTGAKFPLEIAIRAIQNADKPRFVAICRDATVRRAEEERLAFLARHDPVTELPNRTAFIDWLNEELAAPDASGTLMMLSLSGLRELVDVMRMRQGVGVQRNIAQLLTRAMPEGARLASFGNDQFGILMSALPVGETADVIGERLLNAVPRVVSVDGAEIDVDACLGITAYPEHGDNAPRLLRNLDLSIVRARHDGDRKICVFHNDMWAFYRARRAQERDLTEALELGQLELHFQPKVRLTDSKVIGGEALVRWKHPVNGYVSPAEFIPIAETTGLIVPLGQFVVEETVRRIADWTAAGLQCPPIAVNVSPVQFRRTDLVRLIRDATANRELPASVLEIEITETLLVQDRGHASRILTDLRALGARVAIDDFGTGHSSLSYLAELPLDTLKVDQSFVRNLRTSGQNREITRTIVRLAESLELTTVAEGVETNEQAAFLMGIGCTFGQGYFYARPLPADGFAKLIGQSLPMAPQ